MPELRDDYQRMQRTRREGFSLSLVNQDKLLEMVEALSVLLYEKQKGQAE